MSGHVYECKGYGFGIFAQCFDWIMKLSCHCGTVDVHINSLRPTIDSKINFSLIPCSFRCTPSEDSLCHILHFVTFNHISH